MSAEFSEDDSVRFTKRKFVSDVIHPNLQKVRVQRFRMGIQYRTFIRLYIGGIRKIIYIQNLGSEFFSKESVHNFDYIKGLKVECIKDSVQEYKKISLNRQPLQSKYIEK